MTTFMLVLAVWVVLSFPVGALVGRGLKAWALGCSCSKHAWDPTCPVHGRAT